MGAIDPDTLRYHTPPTPMWPVGTCRRCGGECGRDTTICGDCRGPMRAAFNWATAGDDTWMADGLCRQVDPELFFPSSGQSSEPAKSICAECPVRRECADYATRNCLDEGIWAGMTGRERANLRRRKAS